MPATIAVQAFNKAEKTTSTLDSIAACRGADNCNLSILQDGWDESEHAENYRHAQAKTTRAIESWISGNLHRFASVCFDHSDRNDGPYKTAERLLDHAFETSESVIFSEDDIIFEKDALEWFERALANPTFLRAEVWAIAGESKFFDARQQLPLLADISRALEVAETERLMDRFVYVDVMPSSCFATIRDKWAEFGKTRGSANGDVALVRRCRAEGKLCLWPVIARCRDIGMHDPLGWSVRWKGESHPVVKNNYIVSGMLKGASPQLSELVAGKAELFNEFTFGRNKVEYKRLVF